MATELYSIVCTCRNLAGECLDQFSWNFADCWTRLRMNSNENVRRATQTDIEDIISIIPPGEYDGDYLPDYIHMLMDNPLYNLFVFVSDGQTVGTAAIFIIDNGMTGAMRTLRVHKKYQGRGVLRKLQTEIFKHYPNVKHIATTTATNLPAIRRQVDRGVFKLIAKRESMFYYGRLKKNGFDHQTKEESCNTKLLDNESLSTVIREQDKHSVLFAEGRLVVDSVSYRLMESNVLIILMERTSAVVSFVDRKEQTLLTFGSYFRQPNGEMFCKFDIYGTVGDTLVEHLRLHILNFIRLVDGNLTIEVRYRRFSDIIEQSMTKIGLINASIGTERRSVILCLEQTNAFYSQL